jgi:hypothetical protein
MPRVHLLLSLRGSLALPVYDSRSRPLLAIDLIISETPGVIRYKFSRENVDARPKSWLCKFGNVSDFTVVGVPMRS